MRFLLYPTRRESPETVEKCFLPKRVSVEAEECSKTGRDVARPLANSAERHFPTTSGGLPTPAGILAAVS